MKVTFLEHIKEFLKKIKQDTTNKISALGTKTVEAIEEIEAKKADTTHKHGAGDIDSGTLPVDRGGTGNTTGNAATATKLQTARTITLSSDVTGSASFDGSANKTITATLKNSGVTAGTYGANVMKLALTTWISNNRGLHSTTATSTWTAKKDFSLSFRYTVSSESVSCDYLNITAAGTQILANTGGTATTNTLTTTLKTGQSIIFNYRKDGSANKYEDCAKISEVKVTPTGGSATTVTTANFDTYFTAANGTYAFLPLVELQKKSTAGGAGTNGFTLPCVTVDVKGRVTSATEVFIMPVEGDGMTKAEIDNVMKGAGTGNNNVALGINALICNTTGSHNTALGERTLLNNTTGFENTAIGYCALDALTLHFYNATGLGFNSQITGSNQVQLGDTRVTVYAQKALVTRSDVRDKLDIEDSPLGLNFIMKLRPRKYRMNSREAYFEKGKERDFSAANDGSKAGKRPHYGLVAQEVKEAMNELGVDFAGYLDSKIDGGEDVLSLGYTEFIAPMIKSIQQQQAMIEQLQKEVEVWKG